MAEVSVVPKPTDAVRRILTAAGASVPDKEAYWLGFHMERFVKHMRKAGELLDLPTASAAYLSFIATAVPALPDWQVGQVKQALLLFARGDRELALGAGDRICRSWRPSGRAGFCAIGSRPGRR